MAGVSSGRVPIDLDRSEPHRAEAGQRGDYVFVGDDGAAVTVAVIELTKGRIRGGDDARKLQGGADIARGWLPSGEQFRFVPILVHGKGDSKYRRGKSRSAKINAIQFCGRKWQVILTRCGAPLADALAKADSSPTVC